MSDEVSHVSRSSLLSGVTSSNGSKTTIGSLLVEKAPLSLTLPSQQQQPSSPSVDRCESSASPNFSYDHDTVDISTSTLEPVATVAHPPEERNPEFNIDKLPLEEQFNLIEKQFAAIEAGTMNPRLYNFATSNANPTKNRYVNVLANEETIFPPLHRAVTPAGGSGSRRPGKSGEQTSVASTTPPTVKTASSAAQSVWAATGQRFLTTLRGDGGGASASPHDGGGGGAKERPAASSSAGCLAKKRPQWYINANLVDMSVAPVFVASQAPVQECIDDFLSVLYHEAVTLVLMLTEVEEAGLVKADRYWPADSTPAGRAESFGGMCVYKDPQDPYTYDAAYQLVRRPFYTRPSAAPRAPAHKVVLYQYVGWPDHGVPHSTRSFEALLSVIQQHVAAATATATALPAALHAAESEVQPRDTGRTPATAAGEGNGGGGGSSSSRSSSNVDGVVDGNGGTRASPLVLVHCSAGIGRTGTLIGAYTAVELAAVGQLSNSSIPRIVADMRKARFGMVQRVEQYMFLYMIVMKHMGADTRAFRDRMQARADMYNARWFEARQKAMAAARALKK
ncbi:protein-tyrosine phosphatase 1-like protein [Novymonas esmeraldas]|uniref:Protein-tyrosine phosphatase 1-like protein n=1 Tax=Novymonas esmeraldas TaxID=1808958 RepID=A0AAW0F1B4_9TRYP